MLIEVNAEKFKYNKYHKKGIYVEHVSEFINSNFEIAEVVINDVKAKSMVASIYKALKLFNRDDISVRRKGDHVYLVRYKNVPSNSEN